MPISLTGDFDHTGQAMVAAVRLQASLINAQGGVNIGGTREPVIVDAVDDASSAAGVMAAMQSFLASGCQFFVGPFSSELTAVMVAILDQAPYPTLLINGAASATEVFAGRPRVFSVLQPLNSSANLPVQFLHGLGASTVLAITQPIRFLQAACDINFAQEGMQSVTSAPFLLDHSVEEAVTLVQDTKPDMVLLCCLYDDVHAVIEEARRRGVNANAWVAASIFSDPRFRNDTVLADTYLFDVVGWDGSQDPAALLPMDQSCLRWGAAGCISPRQFAALYQQQFGFPPATEVAATFAAVDVMTQAMTASASLDPSVVSGAVLNNGFSTAYGLVRFGFGSHQNYGTYIMRQNQEAAVRVVAPSGFNTSAAVYPAPTWAQLSCFDNGFCGSHGSCATDGTCHCHFGWSGNQCGGAAGLVLLCIGAAVLGLIFIGALLFAIRAMRARKRAAAAAQREQEMATRRTHTRTLTFAAHELSNPASIIAMAAEELRMLARERGDADRLLALGGVAPAGLGAQGFLGTASQRARMQRSYSYGSLGAAAIGPASDIAAAATAASEPSLPVLTGAGMYAGQLLPQPPPVVVTPTGTETERYVPLSEGLPAGASGGSPTRLLPGLTLPPAAPPGQGLGLALAPVGPHGLASIDEATFSAAAAGTPSAHPPASVGAAAPSPGTRPQRPARPRYLLSPHLGTQAPSLVAAVPGGQRLGAVQAAGFASATQPDGLAARRRALQLAQAFAATRDRREREAIRAIRRSARQMKRVLADMAIHSSATESLLMVAPLETDRDAISLAAVIRDVRHRLDQLHGVKVSAAVHEGVPNIIITDALRFQQVIAHSLALVHISALDCSQESGVELDIRIAPPEAAAKLPALAGGNGAAKAAAGPAGGRRRQHGSPGFRTPDEEEAESPVPVGAILPVPVLVPRTSHSPVRKRRGPGVQGGWASPPDADGLPANTQAAAVSVEGRSGESAPDHAVSVLPGAATAALGPALGLPLEHAALNGHAGSPQPHASAPASGAVSSNGRSPASQSPARRVDRGTAGSRLRSASSSSGSSPTVGPTVVLLITGACKPVMQEAQASGILSRGRKRRGSLTALTALGRHKHNGGPAPTPTCGTGGGSAAPSCGGTTPSLAGGGIHGPAPAAAASRGSAAAPGDTDGGVDGLPASGSGASSDTFAPMLHARTYPAPPAAPPEVQTTEAQAAPAQSASCWSLLYHRVSAWLSRRSPARLHPSQSVPPRPGSPPTTVAVAAVDGVPARPRTPVSSAAEAQRQQAGTAAAAAAAPLAGAASREGSATGGASARSKPRDGGRGIFSRALMGSATRQVQTPPPDRFAWVMGEDTCRRLAQSLGGTLVYDLHGADSSFTFTVAVQAADSSQMSTVSPEGEELDVLTQLIEQSHRAESEQAVHGAARDRSSSRGRGVGRTPRGVPTQAERATEPSTSSRLADIAATRAAVLERPIGALVIDDEVVNCRLVRRQLERLGVTAIVLYDGADLDTLAADTVNSQSMILLDIVMPRSNGVQVGKEILRRGFRGTLVAMTANTSPDDVASYRAAGFHEVLGKPFTPDALTALVQRVASGTTPSTGSSPSDGK